nr:hypothetical protein [Noviherbaspirillum denitrificans]
MLDRKAMSSIRGGDGSWVFGAFRPYNRHSNPFGGAAVVNFYQINNYADQMINQVQMVDINNTAANANINVGLNEASTNIKPGTNAKH